MKAKLITRESVLLDQIAWNDEKTQQGFISEFDPEYLPLISTESPDTAPFGRFYKPHYQTEDGNILQKWELNQITLDEAKQIKIQEIEIYDKSIEVNEFFIKDKSMWIDRATRAALRLRFESEKQFGATESNFRFNGESISMNIDEALTDILPRLEVYTAQCYDKTEDHKVEVNLLQTIQEVEDYQFKNTYPPKLYF